MASVRSLLAAAIVAAASAAGCSAPAAGTGAEASWDGGVSCASCHMVDYPAGHVGKKPTTCGVCHGNDAWHPTATHHDFWPLTGKHEKAACFDCHEGTPPTFAGTKSACVSCHLADYEKAPGHPGHRAQTCEDCHSTDAWKPQLPSAPHTTTTPPAEPTASSKPTAAPTSPRPPPAPTPPRPKPPAPVPTVDPTSQASKRY